MQLYFFTTIGDFLFFKIDTSTGGFLGGGGGGGCKVRAKSDCQLRHIFLSFNPNGTSRLPLEGIFVKLYVS
jgi:hypothetical protein